MGLKSDIDASIKEAMKAKDADALRALRSIKSLILLAETSEGQQGELSKESELKLLTKAAKQRKESLEVFITQNRPELAAVESAELAIIEKFLPKQLSESEIAEKLKEIITKTGAKGPQDIGKVMGVATKELAGLADGKLVSTLVKSLLG